MKEKENTDLILLNIGYAVHRADWNYKNVNSPFARIYLVKEGVAKLHLQDRDHIQLLTPGHLYLIPPFTLHSYECDDFYTLYYIHIYENPLSSQRILEDYIFPVEVEATRLDSELVGQLAAINPGRNLKEYDPSNYDNSSTLMQNILLHTKNPAYTVMETQGILLQLLSHFMKEATHKYEITDNRIRKTIRHIRKNIDKNITIDELTEICCLSKDHFIRLFKEEMHTTPVQYINQKKIERAQLLIITDHHSIKDIAYTLSFENVSYFNRLFKRYTGMTPVLYKKKL
nr:AraC family transcriptional regulator [Parabacteroides goldsteinii]